MRSEHLFGSTAFESNPEGPVHGQQSTRDLMLLAQQEQSERRAGPIDPSLYKLTPSTQPTTISIDFDRSRLSNVSISIVNINHNNLTTENTDDNYALVTMHWLDNNGIPPTRLAFGLSHLDRDSNNNYRLDIPSICEATISSLTATPTKQAA